MEPGSNLLLKQNDENPNNIRISSSPAENSSVIYDSDDDNDNNNITSNGDAAENIFDGKIRKNEKSPSKKRRRTGDDKKQSNATANTRQEDELAAVAAGTDKESIFEHKKTIVINKRLQPLLEKLERYLQNLEQGDVINSDNNNQQGQMDIENPQQNLESITAISLNEEDKTTKIKEHGGVRQLAAWPYNQHAVYPSDVHDLMHQKRNLVLKLQEHRLRKGQMIERINKHPRTWSHHDALLEEMKCMATDFYQESLYKRSLLKGISSKVKDKYETIENRKVMKASSVCADIASMCKNYWLNKMHMKRNALLLHVGESGIENTWSNNFKMNINSDERNEKKLKSLQDSLSDIESIKLRQNSSVVNVLKAYHQAIDGLVFSVLIESEKYVDQMSGITNYLSSFDTYSLVISSLPVINSWISIIGDNSASNVVITKIDDVLTDVSFFTKQKWKCIVFDAGCMLNVLCLPQKTAGNVIKLLSQLSAEKTKVVLSQNADASLSKEHMRTILQICLCNYIEVRNMSDFDVEKVFEAVLYRNESKSSTGRNDKIKFTYTLHECEQTPKQSRIRLKYCDTYEKVEKCCNHPDTVHSNQTIRSSKHVESIAHSWFDSLMNDVKSIKRENYYESDILLPKSLAVLLHQYELGAHEHNMNHLFKRCDKWKIISESDHDMVDADISKVDTVDERASLFPFTYSPSIGHDTLDMFKIEIKDQKIKELNMQTPRFVSDITIPHAISIPMNKDVDISGTVLVPSVDSLKYASGKLEKLFSIISTIKQEEHESASIIGPAILVISKDEGFLNIISCIFNKYTSDVICEKIDAKDANNLLFNSSDDGIALLQTRNHRIRIGLCLPGDIQEIKNRKVSNLHSVILTDAIYPHDFLDNFKTCISQIVPESERTIEIIRMATKDTMEEQGITQVLKRKAKQSSPKKPTSKKSEELLDYFLTDQYASLVQAGMIAGDFNTKEKSNEFGWESCISQRSMRSKMLAEMNIQKSMERYSSPLLQFSFNVLDILTNEDINKLYERDNYCNKSGITDEDQEEECYDDMVYFYDTEYEASHIHQPVLPHYSTRDIMGLLPHNIENSISNHTVSNEIHWVISSRTTSEWRSNDDQQLQNAFTIRKKQRDDSYKMDTTQPTTSSSSNAQPLDNALKPSVPVARGRSESLIDILTSPVKNNAIYGGYASPPLTQPDKSSNQQQLNKKKKDKSTASSQTNYMGVDDLVAAATVVPPISTTGDNIEPFTATEDDEILRYYERYGDNWPLIADCMNRNKDYINTFRSARQISDRYLQMKKDIPYRSTSFIDVRDNVLILEKDNEDASALSNHGYFFLRGM